MKTVGIIPLRSGSKRIPLKNFQMLCGKPLYQWAMDSLVKAAIFDELAIIADAEAIRLIKFNGYSDLFTLVVEPDELAKDNVPMEPVLACTIERIGGADKALLRHATSPLVPPEYIKQCVGSVGKRYNSAFLVCEDKHLHWEHLFDTWIPCFEKRALSQDRIPQYVETGGAYAFNVEAFMRTKSVTVGPTTGVPIPPEYAIDIDEWHDLWMAEAILRRRQIDGQKEGQEEKTAETEAETASHQEGEGREA